MPDLGPNPLALPSVALVEIERLLHDLAQPLTLLQCRLELASMDPSDHDAMHETVGAALQDTQRLFAGVNQFRVRILGEKPPGEI